MVRNEDVIAMAGVDEAEFDAACRRELAEIERRRHLYIGARICPEAVWRVAIVARAALRGVRARRPKTLVLALPVALLMCSKRGFVTPPAACWMYVGAVAEGYEENQLRRISVPARGHRSGDLALSPVHTQLS